MTGCVEKSARRERQGREAKDDDEGEEIKEEEEAEAEGKEAESALSIARTKEPTERGRHGRGS